MEWTPAPMWTIVVAGGSGTRIGGTPKQYRLLGGEPVLVHSIRAMAAASDAIVVVVDDLDRAASAGVSVGFESVAAIVRGGADRRASVAAGLLAVPPDVPAVAVHDAARPFASPDLLRRTAAALRDDVDGVVPAVAVADTIKEVDDAGRVLRTPDRDHLVAAQTPQVFRAESLRAAHRSVPGAVTDDAGLVEAAGGVVVTVAGDPRNLKLTNPEDFEVGERRLAGGWC